MDTKTERVRDEVFHAILRGEYAPGDRIPTEREMTDLTGTSRITIRRAFAELEAAGILERRQGSGTYISTAARGNRQKGDRIALLASVRDPFATEFIEAMEKAVTDRDALLVLRLTDEDAAREEEAAIQIVGKGVRNLVVWPSGGLFAGATFNRLRVLGANLVFFDRMLPGAYADYVGLDNEHALETLVGRAFDDGYPALLFLNHAGLDADSDRLREEAFVRACEARGIAHDTLRLDRHAPQTDALQARMQARGDPGSVGVVGVNDAMALLAGRILGRSRGVYGIDGLPEARAAGIASITQPMRAMAEQAVELLFSQQRRGADWTPQRLFLRGTLRPADPSAP